MSVLQRKARAGTQDYQSRSMTVAKALRVGLAKTADDVLDMALAVIGATQESCENEALSEALDDQDLLILLDGPRGITAGAVLGRELVSALVQHQTTGRVSPPTDEARVLTTTDASLCAPVLEGLLKRAHEMLDTDGDRALLRNFKFGAKSEDKRLMQLALVEPQYYRIRLTIDIAAGVAQSHLDLFLPLADAITPAEDVSPNEDIVQKQAATLQANIMGLKTELSAVLCSISMPLSRVGSLAPGDRLQVPANAFDEVTMFAGDGRRICSGALGHVDGTRAFMVAGPDKNGIGLSGENDDLFGYGVSAEKTLLSENEFASPTPEIMTPENLELALPDQAIDIPELPDLDTFGAERNSPTSDELPDLPDLEDLPDLGDAPDLGDLPDLDDLPKLNIA